MKTSVIITVTGARCGSCSVKLDFVLGGIIPVFHVSYCLLECIQFFRKNRLDNVRERKLTLFFLYCCFPGLFPL
jgi:hypothetical protein